MQLVPDWIDLIKQLGAPEFSVRQAASRHLRRLGEPAIAPLKKALPDSSPEVRLRIDSLLRELERNSFQGRLATAAKMLTPEAAAELPEWKSFSALAGQDEAAVARFVRLQQSEPLLFSMVGRSPSEVSRLLEFRSAELRQTTRPATSPVKKLFSVDSYAAVLLLAGNEKHRLVRGTSTSISALLSHEDFALALKAPGGDVLLRLAGRYIQRPQYRCCRSAAVCSPPPNA